MKIILFQGNPGEKYRGTRHNVGFELADFLAEKFGAKWQEKSRFKADLAEVLIAGEKILLVKPRTFYNLTGDSARAICDFYKADSRTDFLAVHDDLSLNFGVVRTRQKGSSAGNNGLKSLISTFGEEFSRIKIGIANELLPRMNSADFVLNEFSKTEAEKLPQLFEVCERFVEDFVRNEFENTKVSI